MRPQRLYALGDSERELSRRFQYLIGSDAPRADFGSPDGFAVGGEDAHRLQVWQRYLFRAVMGVAHIVSPKGTFSAYFTNSRHSFFSVA